MTFDCLSPQEIRERYNWAEDKAEILQVLGELTCSSAEEIAALLGVECVYSLYRMPGRSFEFNTAETRRLYDLGLSDAGIAEAVGANRRAISYWRRKEGLKAYTQPTLDPNKALELYQQGMKDAQIAQRCGVTKSTVWSWRKRMGLPVVGKPAETIWRKLPV